MPLPFEPPEGLIPPAIPPSAPTPETPGPLPEVLPPPRIETPRRPDPKPNAPVVKLPSAQPKDANWALWDLIDRMEVQHEDGETLYVHASPRQPSITRRSGHTARCDCH